MARYLIQSLDTGCFLAPAKDGSGPEWVRSLRHASEGVLTDLEMVHQIYEDHCGMEDGAIVVDLDLIGVHAEKPARVVAK